MKVLQNAVITKGILIGVDPSLVTLSLKEYKYDDKRIMTEFSIRRSMKKERLGIEFGRRRLRENKKVKDVLPLTEQIMRI